MEDKAKKRGKQVKERAIHVDHDINAVSYSDRQTVLLEAAASLIAIRNRCQLRYTTFQWSQLSYCSPTDGEELCTVAIHTQWPVVRAVVSTDKGLSLHSLSCGCMELASCAMATALRLCCANTTH